MMDWNREVLGVPLKYAVPLIGAVFVGAVVFILWRARSSAGGGSSATGKPAASTLSASGAQLATAGLTPYYGNGGAVPTGSVSTVPSPVWQFGPPPASGYVWKPTGTNGPEGVDPNNVMPGSGGNPTQLGLPGFGNYSWQWSRVPQGWGDTQYAQALSAALRSGGLTSGTVEQATLSGYAPQSSMLPDGGFVGPAQTFPGPVPAVPAG